MKKDGKVVRLNRYGVILLVLISLAALFFSVKFFLTVLYPMQYSDIVEKYSAEYGIDSDLIYSVIKNESNFDKNAVSSVGAKGLMQITEDTFHWAKSRMGDTSDIAYADIFDEEINIKYGTFILKLLSDEFRDQRTVLCAYHAGRGSVISWLKDERYSMDGVTFTAIPYPTTWQYSLNVIKTKEIYHFIYRTTEGQQNG